MEGTLDQNDLNDEDYSDNYEEDAFDEEDMINQMNDNQR